MGDGEILDNVVRRQRYEAEHPGAEIRYHRDHHFWQAIIPEGNGEIVLTVHGSRGLGELMDRLESRERSGEFRAS